MNKKSITQASPSFKFKNRSAADLNLPSYQVLPIGYLRSAPSTKFEAPHQPSGNPAERSFIELHNDISFEHALSDLESFSHIWVVWWFHKTKSWKPKVLPPRGPVQKRGVFATRSPHRFNPIGLTAVQLLGISGNVLEIGSNDLIEGTPILDIKPYLPKNDIFADANSGWVSEMEDYLENAETFNVELRPLAEMQLSWLQAKQINFFERAKSLLASDPHPHRTRRISKLADGSLRMGCAGWRVHYFLEDQKVLVTHFSSGYPPSSLSPDGAGHIVNFEEQLEFQSLWS